jgi:hypothetical protein
MSSLIIDSVCTRTSRKGIVLSKAHWFFVYVGMPFRFNSTYRYQFTKTMVLGTLIVFRCTLAFSICSSLVKPPFCWSFFFLSSRHRRGSYNFILSINLIHCRIMTAVGDLIIVYISFVFFYTILTLLVYKSITILSRLRGSVTKN